MEIRNPKSKLEIIKTAGILIIAVCSIIQVIQGFVGTQDVFVRSGNVKVDNTVDVRVDDIVDVWVRNRY